MPFFHPKTFEQGKLWVSMLPEELTEDDTWQSLKAGADLRVALMVICHWSKPRRYMSQAFWSRIRSFRSFFQQNFGLCNWDSDEIVIRVSPRSAKRNKLLGMVNCFTEFSADRVLEPERRKHEFQTAWAASYLRRKSEGSEGPVAKRTANAYQLFQKQRRPAEKTMVFCWVCHLLRICRCSQHMLVFGENHQANAGHWATKLEVWRHHEGAFHMRKQDCFRRSRSSFPTENPRGHIKSLFAKQQPLTFWWKWLEWA